MPENEKNYASVIRRVLAYAVDAVILFVAFPLILGAVFALLLYSTVGLDWMLNGLLFWLYVFSTVSLPFWLYYSLLESSSRQATFGMRLFRLQVADTSGRRISFGRALLRTVVKLLPFELNHLVLFLPTPIWGDPEPGFRFGFVVVNALMILYIATPFLTRRKQSVHDLIAGTVVLNAK
ncbi:MAG: RDD family protein [Pyrinomonadaceae bacterium]